MLNIIAILSRCILLIILAGGAFNRKRSATSVIVWCATPSPFTYDLAAGVFCDNMVELTSTLDTFSVFNQKLSKAISNHSAVVRFNHINKFYYGNPSTKQSLNLAYTLLTWSIMNLKPKIDRLWLEFGVSAGASINITSILRGPQVTTPVYGFDSFEGLPEHWNEKFPAGTFTRNGSIPMIEKNVELIVGLFNQTLEPFLNAHPNENVGFVNIDMDLYKGAHFVLSKLMPRFEPGSIIHFHEFFSYNPVSKTLGGEAEMRALYYAMKQSTTPRTFQLLPFQSRYREPVVFVVQ